jgi:hypothetical protein
MIFVLVFGLPTEPALTIFEENVQVSSPLYFKWRNVASWNDIFNIMYEQLISKRPSKVPAIDPGWGERPLASPNPLPFFPSDIPRPPPPPSWNEILLVPSPSPTSEDGLLRLWLYRGISPSNLMRLEDALLVVAREGDIDSWPSCAFLSEDHEVVCTGRRLCDIWKLFKPRSIFKFSWSDCEVKRLPL